MNNRFKSRVWITAPITRDVEEEKEVSFYIYDIALYDDGGIGFSRDSLLDALDKLNLTEGQRNEIEDYISDNSYSEDWEWYAISFDIIEQYTGLKDKNGKLIYEGDIVIKSDVSAIGYSRTRVCKVHWHNDWLSWAITTQYGDTYELSEFEPQQYEVIGNIHENADLLETNND